jgi:membrane-associated phospholipid phosphatase
MSADIAAIGSADALRRAQVWRGIRWGATVVYAFALVTTVVVNKTLPLEREAVLFWIAAALAITCIGRANPLQVVIDWLPFGLALVAYEYSRGFADELGKVTNFTPQLDADKLLFGGTVPTVWLQEHFLHRTAQWWDLFAFVVYMSHFFVPFILAAVLWSRRRSHFRLFAACFVAVSFLAALTFALFPAAPPWMAGRDHLIPHVSRSVGRGWGMLGLHPAKVLFDKGAEVGNPVAAIPSLHAGFALLVVIVLWRMLPMWWRPLLVAYPLLMGLTLVYSGEHYVVDILLGWLYVVFVLLVAEAWRRYRDRGPAITAEGSPAPPDAPPRPAPVP